MLRNSLYIELKISSFFLLKKLCNYKINVVFILNKLNNR